MSSTNHGSSIPPILQAQHGHIHAAPAEDATPTANGFPRRNRVDLWTPAERAIYDAMQAVEQMPAHPLLTDAVILLGKARDRVADFVDDVEHPKRYVNQYGDEVDAKHVIPMASEQERRYVCLDHPATDLTGVRFIRAGTSRPAGAVVVGECADCHKRSKHYGLSYGRRP